MTDIRVNSLAIPLMPSLVHMLDYQRIGEVAGRSLFPCLLQVDAVASVWLCSPSAHARRLTSTLAFGCLRLHILRHHLAFRLLNRVGGGDISAHRRG
jgi:hypothetical protein